MLEEFHPLLAERLEGVTVPTDDPAYDEVVGISWVAEDVELTGKVGLTGVVEFAEDETPVPKLELTGGLG